MNDILAVILPALVGAIFLAASWLTFTRRSTGARAETRIRERHGVDVSDLGRPQPSLLLPRFSDGPAAFAGTLSFVMAIAFFAMAIAAAL